MSGHDQLEHWRGIEHVATPARGALHSGCILQAEMNEECDFAFDLLDQVRVRAPSDFTGLGLVLYTAPLRLPVAALGDQSLFRPALPVRGAEQIAGVLAEISTASSPWHDGFHLLDVHERALTHVCQFLAPPLELVEAPLGRALPVGARHSAAVAGSRLESVACTALLSNSGGALVFHRGVAMIRPSK